MLDIVGAQFLEGGKIQYYQSPGLALQVDTMCVVETEHGPSLARITRANLPLGRRKFSSPLKRVLRVATPNDLEQLARNQKLEREAFRLCRNLADEKKLGLKLVDVTYTLDGRKAVFYFTSESRVDFRELVKDLARSLRVKIEMRQIGVRDEARRLGGVGACGTSLCCCTFLKDFVSVSIRMAKDQHVSLNPTKVSGICGRLMCCLSYEYEGPKGKRKSPETKPGSGDGARRGAGRPECGACENSTCGEHVLDGEADAATAPAPGDHPESQPAPTNPGQRPNHPPLGHGPNDRRPGQRPGRPFYGRGGRPGSGANGQPRKPDAGGQRGSGRS